MEESAATGGEGDQSEIDPVSVAKALVMAIDRTQQPPADHADPDDREANGNWRGSHGIDASKSKQRLR
jgi:hypothetical protein